MRSVAAASLPWLSEEQMIEVDRIMAEDLHIELIQMMENAGRNLARLAIERYRPAHAVVACGSGGNGGGGMVAARHLRNHGVDVTVLLTSARDRHQGVPGHQLDILTRMGVATTAEIGSPDLLIDAMIGYSLRGAPSGTVEATIHAANTSTAPTISLDVPSGLNVTTGETPGAHVDADATLTLAAPKQGLRHHRSVGELFVADISVPPSVYPLVGATEPPPFANWILGPIE